MNSRVVTNRNYLSAMVIVALRGLRPVGECAAAVSLEHDAGVGQADRAAASAGDCQHSRRDVRHARRAIRPAGNGARPAQAEDGGRPGVERQGRRQARPVSSPLRPLPRHLGRRPRPDGRRFSIPIRATIAPAIFKFKSTYTADAADRRGSAPHPARTAFPARRCRRSALLPPDEVAALVGVREVPEHARPDGNGARAIRRRQRRLRSGDRRGGAARSGERSAISVPISWTCLADDVVGRWQESAEDRSSCRRIAAIPPDDRSAGRAGRVGHGRPRRCFTARRPTA